MDLQQNAGMSVRAGLQGYKESSYCPLYHSELTERKKVGERSMKVMLRQPEPRMRYGRDPIILLLQPIPAHTV